LNAIQKYNRIGEKIANGVVLVKKNNILKDDLKAFSLVIRISFSVITPVLIGFFLGKYLDKSLNLKGIATTILTILGGVSGLFYLLKVSTKLNK